MYNITSITTNDEIEPLGTKEKFWFYDVTGKKLFKVGRNNTGENWAEKLAYELAILIKLPCAKYEFAQWNNKIGTISSSFVPENGRLIHGNELLARVFKEVGNCDYPKNSFYKVKEYRLQTVLLLIEHMSSELPIDYQPSGIIQKSIDVFIGYLVFDCWISNQDRHHENWGLIWHPTTKKVHLAPTYDHASGLASKVSNTEAKARLNTNDKGYSVAAFVKKANTPFHDKEGKKLKSMDAIKMCVKQHKAVTCYWIMVVESICIDKIRVLFDNIPDNLIEQYQKLFSIQMLMENTKRLKEIKKEFCHD